MSFFTVFFSSAGTAVAARLRVHQVEKVGGSVPFHPERKRNRGGKEGGKKKKKRSIRIAESKSKTSPERNEQEIQVSALPPGPSSSQMPSTPTGSDALLRG